MRLLTLADWPSDTKGISLVCNGDKARTSKSIETAKVVPVILSVNADVSLSWEKGMAVKARQKQTESFAA